MNKDRIEEIKKLCERATPGKWDFERISHENGEFSYEINDYSERLIAVYEHNYDKPMMAKFDAVLMFEASTIIPELITALENGKEEIKRLQHIVDWHEKAEPVENGRGK